jgi:MFS family permease
MSAKIITRTVWILSLVSLFTDVASEMLYPVMPIFLKSIGFSIILIGILEGVAEATAGFSKGYFGNLSDNIGKRLPFIQIGYGLSAISKPMMAAFVFPVWIFFARTIDRLGKGVRTGARDALLSDQATAQTKARVFGFHRSLDTFGAVLGPLLALIYLVCFPANYKMLFLIAFVPGVIAILFTFFIKEKKKVITTVPKKTKFLDFIKYWKTSPKNYKKLVVGLLVFTLFNSSDIFLLLKIKEAGYSDTIVIGAYIFYNSVYASVSYPIGVFADKMGMKKIFVFGLILFAFTYFGMVYAYSEFHFFVLFFTYGIYAAATEGIAKAWITNICEKEKTATAIGTYAAFQSIATLLASSLTGLLWYSFGSSVVFITSAIVAIVVAFYIGTKIHINKNVPFLKK